MCLARKVTTPATIADHIVPHKGDEHLFYFGELQSLCQHCHNSRKKHQEMYGYQRDIGADGWPNDPEPSGEQAAGLTSGGARGRRHLHIVLFSFRLGPGGGFKKVRPPSAKTARPGRKC